MQVIHIPFGWEEDLTSEYTQQIKYICLIFSKGYIRNNFCDILKFENVIEKRLTGDLRIEELYKTNDYNLEQCMLRNYNHVLIDDYRRYIEFLKLGEYGKLAVKTVVWSLLNVKVLFIHIELK